MFYVYIGYMHAKKWSDFGFKGYSLTCLINKMLVATNIGSSLMTSTERVVGPREHNFIIHKFF